MMELRGPGITGALSFMENNMKVTFLSLALLLSACASAQPQREAVWFDGTEEKKVYLQDDLVAHFQDVSRDTSNINNSNGAALGVKNATVVVSQGPVSIVKVSATDRKLFDSTAMKQKAKTSPVYRTEPQSGSHLTLPGGVLVTFDKAMAADTSRVNQWARDQNLSPERQLPGMNTWLFKTPSGIASLNKANELRTKPGVVAAQPNWWMERTSKPVPPKPVNVSPAELNKRRQDATRGY